MKIALIAFSVAGATLAARIAAAGNAYGRGDDAAACEFEGYIAKRHADKVAEACRFRQASKVVEACRFRQADKTDTPMAFGLAFEPFDSVYTLAERLFREADALVFVGACGIAVRAVAPLVASKLTDPAVVVCDETGRFAVSLLSGHAGGANLLAEQIAAAVGATPVITTASDSHTVYGGGNTNAAQSGLPQPRDLVLGVGCRRGLPAETIERAATIMLWDERIPLARVAEIATIDIKSDEAGLLGFARAHGIPLRFFSAAELAAVEGEFTGSERVLRAVGVDNVCERAAMLCGRGELIMRKTAMRGVTVAVANRCEKR